MEQRLFAAQQVNEWLKIKSIENSEISDYLAQLNWRDGVSFFMNAVPAWLDEVERRGLSANLLQKYLTIKNANISPHPLYDLYKDKHFSISVVDSGLDLFNQLKVGIGKICPTIDD